MTTYPLRQALDLRQLARRARHKLRWRIRLPRFARTLGLLVGSALWLGLYGWLGWRLLGNELTWRDPLSWLLGVACVALGVAIFWVWRKRARQTGIAWRNRRQGTHWAPLTQAQLLRLTPSQFEEYVARRIFERQGFRIQNTPDVKDGGIDILLTDPSGRPAIVQCKRYKGTVGSATVRELYGTMIHAGAAEAFLATASGISQDARAWAADKPIYLLDGEELARLARLPANALEKSRRGT